MLKKDFPSSISLNNLSEHRIDVLCRVITNAFYLDNDFRKDVRLIVLSDKLTLEFDGSRLRGIRPDERTNAGILKKVLSGGRQPGITLLTEYKLPENAFWLDIEGEYYQKKDPGQDPVFVIGGEQGMTVPENANKLSLGKKSYLASQCVTILNHWMDVKEWSTKK